MIGNRAFILDRRIVNNFFCRLNGCQWIKPTLELCRGSLGDFQLSHDTASFDTTSIGFQ
jgi:hypothetical protein